VTSFGRASLKDIEEMLQACAPGFTIERKKHRYWVRYNNLIFRGLPTGEHGDKKPEIEVGIIRQMIRYLGIEKECAKKHLPILK